MLVLSFSAPVATATSEVEGPMLSIGAETLLPPTPTEGTVAPRTGKILKELGKQAIDQPAHFLMAAAPLLAYREWLQWPSNRWWDPPLDWAVLTIGMVVATWSRGPAHIALSLSRSIREARRAVAWRGDAARRSTRRASAPSV